MVRKLWHYCNVLRNDGLSYPDYVEQLTYLLFLKMAAERGTVEIPRQYSWLTLVELDATSLHQQYSEALLELGKRGGVLGVIFKNARNKIKDPKKLRFLVVDLIGRLQWTELAADVKGDAYEGLLEKNAQDTKSGAGQYFTPRPLIDAIVECVRPLATEVVCDPACGTGGFLLAAHDFIQRTVRKKGRRGALGNFHGTELVEEVARLATMNLLLHGLGNETAQKDFPITCEDSLASPPRVKADVVLTNPPFGIRGSMKEDSGPAPQDEEFEIARVDFWARTANKQLNFLQHIYALLKPGGRAAVVVPDNVLYERGAGVVIRRHLLEQCYVHTVLRLPKGLFYAHGVTANVLFFDKAKPTADSENQAIWVYNLRAEKQFSLKKSPLQLSDLDDFIRKYKAGKMNSRRESRLFRSYPLKQVLRDPSCRLDFDWGQGGSTVVLSKGSPAARLKKITTEISNDLEAALKAIARVAGKRR